MLDIEMHSSSDNNQLKTFLSATESVMIDEIGESMDNRLRWMTFQTMTKLKNYSTCTQVRESTKCHLSKLPVWPKQGRSEGDALTLDFLAQYSAAFYVDLFHFLSLEEHTKDKTNTVTHTVPMWENGLELVICSDDSQRVLHSLFLHLP
jgi:hypothetical protein